MVAISDIYEDSDTYVCITHKQLMPCIEEGSHLVSNWVSDVQKILKIMEKT
jgi:hypothetical protein